MAISQAMCTSFKQELLVGTHNFTASTGNSFKLALYTSSASLGAGTTAYTSSNEASGTNYSATGSVLTSVTPTTDGTTAICDFSDLTFSNVSITARGVLIYNEDTYGDTSVLVLNFGSDKSSSSGDFTIAFPAADASNAIIRIA